MPKYNVAYTLHTTQTNIFYKFKNGEGNPQLRIWSTFQTRERIEEKEDNSNVTIFGMGYGGASFFELV
jgi:hypothetical protein